MPKLKTHKGTKARIRITKNGKLLRRHATASHFFQKKSAARKRGFAGLDTLDKTHTKTIKRQLGV